MSHSGKTEVQELFSRYNYSTAYAGNVTMNLNFTNNTGTITANNLSYGSRSGSYTGTLTIAPDTGQLAGNSTVSLMLDSNSYSGDILGILGPNSNVAAVALIDQTNKFYGLLPLGKIKCPVSHHQVSHSCFKQAQDTLADVVRHISFELCKNSA